MPLLKRFQSDGVFGQRNLFDPHEKTFMIAMELYLNRYNIPINFQYPAASTSAASAARP